jgi:tRNA dimethylallyltransferase
LSVVALLGVTASGKSELAFDVARRRDDVEIVSVDSMCVYRGMDIATSKPSRDEQAAVPHHLLDLVEPDEEFTVSQFQEAARRALAEIAGRGHHALLVGGTGLYLRAVVDDLRFPGRYPAVRESLETELGAGRTGVAELHARLAVLDPVAAARMEPSNQRRIVRALEVTLGSGRPFSTFGPGLEAYPPSPVTMVGLAAPTGEVDRRIAERFGRWMDEGLLDEVRALAARPGGISPTARQALGYRELLAHVEEGAPLDACVEEAVRRDPRINWTGAGAGPGEPAEPAELLERALGAHASRA